MKQQSHQQFSQLHHKQQPLLLLNTWDAASSALAAKQGAPAIATSSASLCWAQGFQDGNQMPFAELKMAINRILQVVHIPLTVDLENGYSDAPEQVAKHVLQLMQLGVAGINIEDGDGGVECLVDKISAIRIALQGKPLFINARTDVYIRNLVSVDQRVDESLVRASHYVAAGADGVFIPGVEALEEIKELAKGLAVPLNVMVTADQVDIDVLQAAGVARISTGPAPFLSAYSQLLPYAAMLGWKVQNTALTYDNCDALFGRF